MTDKTVNENQYYHGTEADMFSFIQLPKVFFTDPFYKTMKLEAKLIYAAMRDRMSLSINKGWLDQDNRVYIYFTQDTIMEYLDCGTEKAAKVFKELEKYSLIKRKKQGLGRPDMIYVLKISCHETVPGTYKKSSEVLENHRDSIIESQEIRKPDVKRFDNQTSEDSIIEGSEIRNSVTINTEKNKTEFINTEAINTDNPGNLSLSNSMRESDYTDQSNSDNKATCSDEYLKTIREHIMYDSIIWFNGYLEKQLGAGKISLEEYEDQYVDIRIADRVIRYMADVCAQNAPVLVGGKAIKADEVRQRLLCIDREIFVEAMKLIAPRWNGLSNKKGYCITVLYNQ